MSDAPRPRSAIAPPEAGLSRRARENLVVKPLAEAIAGALANQYHAESNPGGIVNLGVAENGLMSNELTEFMNALFRITPYDTTYGDGPLGSRRLRKTLAEFFNAHFNPTRSVLSDEILCQSGLASVVDQFSWILGDPGDGLLVGRPLYSGFVSDIESKSRVKLVQVSLAGLDPFSVEAVHAYEEALLRSNVEGVKIKGMVLCNPHNPLGKCYPVGTIREYMKFCQKHQIHLLADEVYAISIFKTAENHTATPFVSVLSIEMAGIIDQNLVHVLYGMSKDFGCNGLRLGCVITRNSMVYRALASIAPLCWPSSASDLLWSTMLSDSSFLTWYVAENQRRLGAHYNLITKWLNTHDIIYERGGCAGFFVWVDLRFALPGEGTGMSALDRERTLTRRILEAGVYIATGEAFCAEELGWYRITFSQPEDVLMLGLERLAVALNKGRITAPALTAANGNGVDEAALGQPIQSAVGQLNIGT